MTSPDADAIQQLLREIRDTQREHLAEYKSVTQRSLELPQRAVARQEQIGRFTRQIVLVGGLLVLPLLALLICILVKWSGPLFGT
jgi:CHASE3 domain sensor protein